MVAAHDLHIQLYTERTGETGPSCVYTGHSTPHLYVLSNLDQTELTSSTAYLDS